jgi:hypothetical protein
MLEAENKIHFIFYLLSDTEIPFKVPIMVRTDNIGEMFMAENASSGFRVRHTCTRFYFIREHIEDGFI